MPLSEQNFEITKLKNRHNTKRTHSQPNEQLFPKKGGHSATLNLLSSLIIVWYGVSLGVFFLPVTENTPDVFRMRNSNISTESPKKSTCVVILVVNLTLRSKV